MIARSAMPQNRCTKRLAGSPVQLSSVLPANPVIAKIYGDFNRKNCGASGGESVVLQMLLERIVRFVTNVHVIGGERLAVE